MRCLTLAIAFRNAGHAIHFAVSAETAALMGDALCQIPAVIFSGDVAPEQEPPLMERAFGPCDLVIIDHYRREASFETACRSFARQIVAIDDLADRPHAADLVIDCSFGRTAADYARWTAGEGRFLFGPGYAPLRPSFTRRRLLALARRQAGLAPHRILVAFGASDPDNLTGRAIAAIERTRRDLLIDVVLGPAAPCLAEIKRQVTLSPRARLWIGTDIMATLVARADIAIGAAGTAAWERCCLGLPAIIVAAAENQRGNVRALVARGAALESDQTEAGMALGLTEVVEDSSLRKKMAAAAALLCDGHGARRILLDLVPEGTAAGARVRLEPVGPEHSSLIHRWQCQPGTRRYAVNSDVPGAEEHASWFAARLADPTCIFSLITAERDPVGFVRLDRPARGPRSETYEVSIVIGSEHRRQGLGVAALRLVRRLVPEARLVAKILPGNAASIATFRTAGYRPTEDGNFQSLGTPTRALLH